MSKKLMHARNILEGEKGDFGVWSRALAFLLRQALEESLKNIIEMKFDRLIARPSFRSQLIVLGAIVPAQLRSNIAWTWEVLSSATHAHQYQLPPTGQELMRWLESVERLEEFEENMKDKLRKTKI